MQNIPLLMVTSRAEDVEELKSLFRETPWELNDVSNVEQAVAALKAAPVPILLFDRDLDSEHWQATMKRFIHSRRGACLVLVSSVADQYLWDEVVQHGGFDLITRPFRREQVLSTLMFAYAHCRTPWPKAGAKSHS
jgi:FixJ family two-component response regulator